MQLTKNFKIQEFACKDGSQVPQQYIANVQKLANNIQIIRDELDAPIVINSGYRSLSHNTKVGGAKNSQHLTASAGDLNQSKITPKEFYYFILDLIKQGKIYNGGVFLYDTFVHYDIGGQGRRGNYSKKFVL